MMRSTILISLTFLVLATTAFAVDLVRHHPQPLKGVDPLAPIIVKMALS